MPEKDGVRRPWWWSPGKPWVLVGIPAVIFVLDTVRWLNGGRTHDLLFALLFLALTVGSVLAIRATRRQLAAESGSTDVD